MNVQNTASSELISVLKQYMVSYFWVTATISTNGRIGDMNPTNYSRRLGLMAHDVLGFHPFWAHPAGKKRLQANARGAHGIRFCVISTAPAVSRYLQRWHAVLLISFFIFIAVLFTPPPPEQLQQLNHHLHF
jgi:hypothetical protein